MIQVTIHSRPFAGWSPDPAIPDPQYLGESIVRVPICFRANSVLVYAMLRGWCSCTKSDITSHSFHLVGGLNPSEKY